MTGISVLVIGILWPLTIRLMVRLGFGDPEDNVAGTDLSRVSSSTADIPSLRATQPTADDQAGLETLNAELEARMGGMAIDANRPDEEAERRDEQEAIRKLSNAPADAAPTPPDSDGDKEFTSGTFYPVARPIPKK